MLHNDGTDTLTPLYIKWESQLPSQNPQVDQVGLYFTASRNPVQIVKNIRFIVPHCIMNNLAAQAVIQCQARASAIRDGQGGTRAGFSPNTSVYLVRIIPPMPYSLALNTDAVIILPTDGVVNDT